ncbi:MAG: hypothetical protein ACR2QU_12770 [Gammaproteobacteria bacterium]
MHEDKPDMMDEQLSSIFQRSLEQPRDDAFRSAVMHRIERRTRIRQIVLTSSIAAGVLIAFTPVFELTLALSNRLGDVASQINVSDLGTPDPVLVIATVAALACPLLTRLLED